MSFVNYIACSNQKIVPSSRVEDSREPYEKAYRDKVIFEFIPVILG